MNQQIKILSYITKNPERRAELRDGVAALSGKYDLELAFADDDASAIAAMPDTEILLTWTISPEMFAVAKTLKWVHISGAGVEGNMFPAFRDSDVILTNSRGIHGPYMAEWTLAALFYLSQRFAVADAWREDRNWRAAKEPITRTRSLLAGKRVLLVGYGRVGQAIAAKLSAIGMLCEAVDSVPRADRIPVHGILDLPNIIGRFDVVVIALPLTTETRGLFNSELLNRMAEGCILVNLARGKIIQEPALIQALQHGPLGYAALDVFEHEPLPEDSPLFTMPNVFMSPHISGNFPEYTKLAVESFLENLRRYLTGEPLDNPVNKQRGY
jgi:phosphoglycerate dehydrogenase-like enzyme